MEIELSHIFDTPIAELWAVLLDPQKVSKCVPGMQSVEVISDTEYNARIKVKIAFISAHFTIKTVIAEMRQPTYLRADVTGQDSSIGSSVKAVTEMNLTALDDNKTELRVVSKANVLGRLGTLGLSPMKTKAERMWDQFCATLEGVLNGQDEPDPSAFSPVPATTVPDTEAPAATVMRSPAIAVPAAARQPAKSDQPPARRGLFSWGRKQNETGNIQVEIDRAGTRIVMAFPSSDADRCLAWIDRQLGITSVTK